MVHLCMIRNGDHIDICPHPLRQITGSVNLSKKLSHFKMFYFITRQKNNNIRVDREEMKRVCLTEQLGHFTQPAEGRQRDHFLPPLTPSLSSVSLLSLLSLHVYKAAGFTYRPTGKHAEFQPDARFFWLWFIGDKLGHLLCLYNKAAFI